ncbi:hypothetical protein [Streptomyces regalis]|uniref:hypothetical protein n=1 Tax=Streptomyces regalis TaxID=68262 RepID=UPI0031338E59
MPIGACPGQLLLRWYGHSLAPTRLVMFVRDRICVAASQRRRLSPARADDFQALAEVLLLGQARIDGGAGQPRGFATFRLRFADGSWLEPADWASRGTPVTSCVVSS